MPAGDNFRLRQNRFKRKALHLPPCASMIILAAILALSLAPTSPPRHTGDCEWVHGRYLVANGSSVRRIWIIGTKRVVAISDDDNQVPPAVTRYEHANPEMLSDAPLYGDFHICATQPSRPGWMQHIHLTATRNLIFQGKPF
jgi:hypothetical protein